LVLRLKLEAMKLIIVIKVNCFMIFMIKAVIVVATIIFKQFAKLFNQI